MIKTKRVNAKPYKNSILIITAFIISNVFFCASAFCEEKKPEVVDNQTRLSLADTVVLAVQNSRTIKNAYLDRIVQRYDLKVAEDKFTPKPVVTVTAQKNVTKVDGSRTDERYADVEGVITEILPTGGQLNLTASHVYDKVDGSTQNTDLWDVTLVQPLLKGGGIDVTTASVKIARIDEKMNVLSLESTIMDTVTSVIIAYRDLLQANGQRDISRQSLERAKELVAINKELILAGRMAEVEMVQAEADVSNREFDVLSTENSVDSARLSLIRLLDIDKHTMIIPTEEVSLEPAVLDYDKCLTLAFQNRPDYLAAILSLEISKINLLLAKNEKLWDLSLFGGYGGSDATSQGSDTKNWNAGITLSIPLRDLTLEQGYVNARTVVEKAELNLAKLHDNIDIEVKDALRDVEIKMKQVNLAQQSRELSEKKLEIEREKMKAGRSTNFQLVSFQNDLVNAQNNELSAIITYLNALTELDRTLGSTLIKWNINIDEET